MKFIINYILLFFYFFSFSQTTQIGDNFDDESCISPDTSYTNVTACDTYSWNDSTYTQSGTYSYSELNNNEFSMSFDGDNDGISGSASTTLDANGTNLITVSAWIYPKSIGPDGWAQRIFTHSSSSNTTGQQYALNINEYGQIYFLSGSGLFEQNGGNSGATSVILNEWNHVAMTYDGFAIRLYMNGVLDFENYVTDNFPNTIGDFYISQRSDGAERFDGQVDNVNVWNIALSENEILDYMNCPPTGSESGLVGFWNFEEGSGNIAYDLSGNGNHGSISGAAHSTDVPEDSCNICDQVDILNLTITQPDTSYANITACDSVLWNGEWYDSTGTYYYSGSSVINNYSLSFNGSGDNVVVNNSNILNPNQELSISCWVNLDQHSCCNQYVAKWNANFSQYILGSNSQGIYFWLNNEFFQTQTLPLLSTWENISFVYSSINNLGYIYLNSQIVYSFSLTNTNLASTLLPVHLGGNSFGSGVNSVDGKTDNITIWDISLSQQEIQNYMSCPPTGNETGLVGYWNFEEGGGNTAFDLTSNGNNGIINGATYSSDIPEQLCNLNECGTLILDLLIYDNYNTTDTFKICNGESVTIGNNTYITSGSYIDTLTSINGCDSTVNTIIEVFKNDIAQNNITICPGDSISLNSISLNSPSVTITLTSTLPSCAWISLHTSFEDYWNDLYGYEYYCSCANGPTYLGCPNIPTGTFITPSEDVNSLGNSIVNAINLNSDYFYATFNALSNELTIYSTVNDISTIEIDGSSWYISGDNSTCPGPCTSLFQSNQNSSNFLWSTGETTQNIIVSPSESTSYNITQYDFDGFSCVDSVLVNVYQSGCNDPSASNYDPNIICIDNSLCAYIIEGCTDQMACNFNPEANLDNGDCTYPETSYTDTSACESYQWNGQTYTESGIYSQLTYDAQNTHSLEFTGNGYVDFGECLDIVPNSSYPITISWKYYPSINYPPTSSNEDYFFTRGISNSSSDYQFSCHYNGTYLRWTGNGANFYDYYVDLVSVPTWSTFSVVIDMNSNPNTIIYHDSEIIASVDIAYNDGSPTGIFKLGQNNSSFNKGFIDDLMIFNKALSQDEIHNYYICPSSCLENNNIIRYYNFEESTGWVVYDQVPGSSNNGNIINSIHWSSLVVTEHSSCQLTTVDGCDSVAVLNLLILDQIEITQNDTTVCFGDSISINVGNIQNNLPINLQSGLVAYYPFNNNANDESENEHHGLINGATIANDRFGNTGKAYYFDGNSTINIENHSDFNLSTTEKLSVSLWAKSTSNQFVSHILGKRTNSIEYQLAWYDNFNSEYGIGYGNWEHCGIPFPLDEWTHLVMTYNNLEWKLFMNGTLVHSYFNETSSNDGDLIIGGSANYTKFIGIIDEVGVWNRELSEIEILEIYNSINQPNYNILWSTGETTNTINIQANETLTYWVNNSCQTDSVEIAVNIPDTTYIEITACESYQWNGQSYTESGIYYSNNQSIDNHSLDFGSCSNQENEHVNFGDILDMPSSFSVGGWIYSDGCNSTILSKREVTSNGYSGFHLTLDNSFSFHIQDQVPGSGDYVSVTPIINEWIHIVGVFDAGNIINLYINGTLVDSVATTSLGISDNDAPFLMGSLQDPGSWSWNGKLDDIFMFNRALSSSEVNDIYNNCNLTSLYGLEAYWNFEQFDGINVYNQINNSQSGVVNGTILSLDTPNQSCQSTCNDIEVLNLVIVNDDQSGCNDPSATNYDPNIICVDNSLCTYIIEGCTDQEACNFDPSANVENGECIYPSSSEENITVCESYIWNGQTYPESGVYTYTTTNSVGCDSVVYLSLTVHYSSYSFSAIEICNEYEWNGVMYTESGQYSYSTINQYSCDSTANLNLTIINCGCTDPIANNYNPLATQDDGDCTYCTFDVNIISQNPSTTNFCDGYFAMTPTSGTAPYEYEINGTSSTNFYAPACNDIFNIVISDADNCQFEQTLILSDYVGCTDSEALNYDETALFDDQSCIDVVEGCMDENADNYLAEANVDDGNCIFYGCMDQSADNFNETANVDDGSCLYCEINIGAVVSQENTSFDCNGYIILSISSSHNPVSIEWDNGMTGGFMSNLCSGDYNYTATDAQGCVLSGTVTVTGTVEGCTDPLACNYQSVADIYNGSCVYLDDLNVVMNTSDMGHTILTWEPLENVSIYKVYKGTSLDNMQFIGSSFEPNFTEAAFNNQSYYYQVSSTVECFGITNEVFSNPVFYNYTSAFSVDVVVTDASCICCNDGAINYTISGGFPPYDINDIGEQNNLAFGEEKTILVSPAFSGSLFSETYTIGYDQETYGCMDELAINYDECVTVDDGSCEYENLSACDVTPSGLFVDDIIHNRVVFNWSPPSDAPSHYMIRYRPVGSSSWTVMTAGPVNSNEFTGTKRTRYFMQAGTTYQWNIRARNIDDNGTTICQSPWSASHQFTTLDECPNLVNHFVNTEANWVDFNATNPESIIDVYDSKGKLREVETNSFRYVNGNTNGIDVRKGNFTPSTDYEWHTKAWCIGNVDDQGNPDPQYHSGWGEFYQFSTQDPCDKMPTNLYTTTNNNQNLITMNWDTPGSGAPDHYFLELVNETTGQVFQWNNIGGNATSKTKYNQVPGHEFSWRIRGACGSIGTSWATIFTQPVYYTLGAERVENEIFSDLNIYPNPSRGEFNISFDLESRQNVYLNITNYIGEVIFTEELKDQEGQYNKTIDLGDKANGIYMLNIKSNNQNINQKIVIQ